MATVMSSISHRFGPIAKKDRKSHRFAPYSAKRPALPEYESYLEAMDSADEFCAETDVETPFSAVFEDDFVRLSIEEELDMDPSLDMEWSTEDLSILLALFSKDVKV
ncbi:hypothetical protein SDRG_04474 [Saprolegnia diclina VS20]|uniref:Uncharacterized protein n=1 Tax=Saprolegnia diclina (strain VS20) TaxID=1156394 RepID=T0QJ69_SAPDV|nr:hypothetical protein SDRG_04474 [Saprolegnia diclina VS20]EQC38044.1 hypothetical protein SDRG_04474 [Saprolegnia diclina VS20]|eukprot:XP_008608371.1 hypothetical protein SDRG_04474 [Saprolegnia diclina VS20]